MVWTRRRGGSASSTSPSASTVPVLGTRISSRDPGDHTESTWAPNVYLLRISGSVMASHRRSGVVWM